MESIYNQEIVSTINNLNQTKPKRDIKSNDNNKTRESRKEAPVKSRSPNKKFISHSESTNTILTNSSDIKEKFNKEKRKEEKNKIESLAQLLAYKSINTNINNYNNNDNIVTIKNNYKREANGGNDELKYGNDSNSNNNEFNPYYTIKNPDCSILKNKSVMIATNNNKDGGISLEQDRLVDNKKKDQRNYLDAALKEFNNENNLDLDNNIVNHNYLLNSHKPQCSVATHVDYGLKISYANGEYNTIKTDSSFKQPSKTQSKNTIIKGNHHHRKSSSIAIKKDYRVFGENFINNTNSKAFNNSLSNDEVDNTFSKKSTRNFNNETEFLKEQLNEEQTNYLDKLEKKGNNNSNIIIADNNEQNDYIGDTLENKISQNEFTFNPKTKNSKNNLKRSKNKKKSKKKEKNSEINKAEPIAKDSFIGSENSSSNNNHINNKSSKSNNSDTSLQKENFLTSLTTNISNSNNNMNSEIINTKLPQNYEISKESKDRIDLNLNKEDTDNTIIISSQIKKSNTNNSNNSIKENKENFKERKTLKIKISTIPNILKLQEFIQSIYNILKENKQSKSLLNHIDSISEEWLELFYELIENLQESFNTLDFVNIKKYFILQQAFNVILFQSPLEIINEKFLNSVLLSINMFEQNNFLLLGFICGSYSIKEQTDLFCTYTFLIDVLNKHDLFNGNISKSNKEAISQFNMNIQQISFLIKNFIKESSLASKLKSNFKEAYNTNLIHTYINNLNSIGYSDTFNKLEKIYCDKLNRKLSLSSSNKAESLDFLPIKTSSHKFTLVLDLDETLIHYVEENNNAFIQIRPYAEEFIEAMSEYYELVIFTAAMKDYADFVLDRFDINKRIAFRLYREHTLPQDGVNIKNLNRLGRDLKTTMIVDNVEANFKINPNHGYHIKNFEGEEEDEELYFLQIELIKLAEKNPDNIEDYIPILRYNMNNRSYKNSNNV